MRQYAALDRTAVLCYNARMKKCNTRLPRAKTLVPGFITYSAGNCRGCFVYILVEGRTVVYVGYTSRLQRRVTEHRSRKSRGEDYDFDSVLIRRCKGVAEAKAMETDLIEIFEPPYNFAGRSRSGVELLSLLGFRETEPFNRRI